PACSLSGRTAHLVLSTFSLLLDHLLFCRCRRRSDPHSFPTRRSSDLRDHAGAVGGHALSTDEEEARREQRRAHGGRPPHPSKARDRKSTRLNSSHGSSSYAVACLKRKNSKQRDCESQEEARQGPVARH